MKSTLPLSVLAVLMAAAASEAREAGRRAVTAPAPASVRRRERVPA